MHYIVIYARKLSVGNNFICVLRFAGLCNYLYKKRTYFIFKLKHAHTNIHTYTHTYTHTHTHTHTHSHTHLHTHTDQYKTHA